MERAAQTFLYTAVHDVVVGEFVVGIVIRMPRHLIGELFDILHVLAVGGTVILCEMPLAVFERKCDMVPVAVNDARRIAGHGIRGDIDIRARRVLVIAVVDLFRIDLCMGRLIIDVEVIHLDTAAFDRPREVKPVILDLRLRVIRHLIVKLVVPRIRSL